MPYKPCVTSHPLLTVLSQKLRRKLAKLSWSYPEPVSVSLDCLFSRNWSCIGRDLWCQLQGTMSSRKVEETVRRVCKDRSVLSNWPFINKVRGVSPNVQLTPLLPCLPRPWTPQIDCPSCFDFLYLLYLLFSSHRLSTIDRDQALEVLWLFLWLPLLPPNVWHIFKWV